MKEQKIKDSIIKDIRQALFDKNQIDASSENRTLPRSQAVGHVCESEDEASDLPVDFVKHYSEAGGIMSYCATEGEIQQQIVSFQRKLGNPVIGCCSENLAAFITHSGVEDAVEAQSDNRYKMGALLCENLLADSGSIVLSDKLGFGTAFSVLPDNTIILAFTSQVVAGWDEAAVHLRDVYKSIPQQVVVLRPGAEMNTKFHLILIEDL